MNSTSKTKTIQQHRFYVRSLLLSLNRIFLHWPMCCFYFGRSVLLCVNFAAANEFSLDRQQSKSASARDHQYNENVLNVCVCERSRSRVFMFTNTDLIHSIVRSVFLLLRLLLCTEHNFHTTLTGITNRVDIPMNIEATFCRILITFCDRVFLCVVCVFSSPLVYHQSARLMFVRSVRLCVPFWIN